MCALTNQSNVRNGDLVLVQLSTGIRVKGYWLTVDGCGWILQPHRWIRITGPVQIIEKGGERQ